MIRTISQIGSIWPRCKTCGHIAQAHDNDVSCGEMIMAKCPTCNTHGVILQCACSGYVGMTREEWFSLLTPEEIAYYHYSID